MRVGATPYCMAPAVPADTRGLAPEWRYLPLRDCFQHRVTGEVRAHGSSLGCTEQLVDMLFSLHQPLTA
jgi:hypothetical protein